jgi:hypothetical protein
MKFSNSMIKIKLRNKKLKTFFKDLENNNKDKEKDAHSKFADLKNQFNSSIKFLKPFKSNFGSHEKLIKLLQEIRTEDENRNKIKNPKKHEIFLKAYEKCMKYMNIYPYTISYYKIYKAAKKIYDIISAYYEEDKIIF